MYGINLHPLVPMRAGDSERSEMVSQLLYGELLLVAECREKWLLVENFNDNYRGWVDRKMIQLMSDKDFEIFTSSQFDVLYYPINKCMIMDSGESVYLPAGSRLYQIGNNNKSNFFPKITYNPIYNIVINYISGEKIIDLAKQFLNAPYLWGGKSIMGIDCSGLVQVVFSMLNLQLPRDANEQALKGEAVSFLEEAQTGDLAFFANEAGNIIHVGILLGNNQIIHASGWVKIENIDANGIISNDTGQYSHQLRLIKRLIEI